MGSIRLLPLFNKQAELYWKITLLLCAIVDFSTLETF